MEHVKLLRVSHLARRHRMHWMVASRSCGAQPRHKLRACKHSQHLIHLRCLAANAKLAAPAKSAWVHPMQNWRAPGDYPVRPWPAVGRQL